MSGKSFGENSVQMIFYYFLGKLFLNIELLEMTPDFYNIFIFLFRGGVGFPNPLLPTPLRVKTYEDIIIIII